MRVHVALTPGEFSDAPLADRTAFAVDVLRATTPGLKGKRALVPVGTAPDASPDAPEGAPQPAT